MDISGEYSLAPPRQEVWDSLLDADVLRRCIPGCEELEQLEGGRYRARVKTAIGPVKAVFESELAITNANPPESYRLEGESKAGAAGFGKGYADVTLTETSEGTLLSYTADFQVGGRLAQLGSRLVGGATRKIADDFFSRLTADIDKNAKRVEPEREQETERGGALRVITIAIVTIVVVGLVWWLV